MSIPKFACLKTVARELDCGVTTVRSYVDRGILPQPIRIAGLTRWRWADIESRIDPKDLTLALSETDGKAEQSPDVGDPILRAINAS